MASDLESLLATSIQEPIDLTIVNSLLLSPPFTPVPGLFNVRNLNDGKQPQFRHNYMFRAGSFEKLTDEGKQSLTSLGITDIFDLRSERERKVQPDPEIAGITNHWYPSTIVDLTTTPQQNPTKPTFSFTKMYSGMLVTHNASFKAVFEHIRDHPDRPFLFHCTAGKDRTGLMAALILGLADVPLEYINHDYALTRIGIEPVREFMIHRLTAGNPKALEDLFTLEYTRVP